MGAVITPDDDDDAFGSRRISPKTDAARQCDGDPQPSRLGVKVFLKLRFGVCPVFRIRGNRDDEIKKSMWTDQDNLARGRSTHVRSAPEALRRSSWRCPVVGQRTRRNSLDLRLALGSPIRARWLGCTMVLRLRTSHMYGADCSRVMACESALS